MAALCLLVLALSGVGIYFGARVSLLTNVDGALLGIARAELASALDGPNGMVHIHEEGRLALRGAVGYEKYAWIRDAGGNLAAHTSNLPATELPKLDEGALRRTREGVAVFGDLEFRNQALRAVYYPFRDLKGRPYTAVCAVPYAPMRQSLRLLGTTLALALLLGAALALYGARRIADRLTGPLAELSLRARHIGSEGLHERLPALSSDAELVGVTEGLNVMLQQLETAFVERERLLERQRQFLSDASHELRTPVTNLRGTLEVALRRPRTAESYHEMLESCLPEVERMSVLVRDLLELARAESGGFSLNLENVDLRELARLALAAHETSAAEKEVALDLVGSQAISILADPIRLRQVLENLLENALRFAPTGSIVTVETTVEDGGAMLRVLDRGPGISEAELPHVFERFWRADSSRNRATGGLGLGLAISKSLVEAHGGTIQVTSEPGEGACFTIRVPLSAEMK